MARSVAEFQSSPNGRRAAGLLRAFRVPLSNRQQAVDIYLVLRAYIYMPVHHHRDVEAEGKTGAVPSCVLLAVIEFMRHIRSIISVESRGLVGCVPDFGA